MKHLKIALLACMTLVLASCGKAAENDDFVIKRGTNLSHWLSQSAARGARRAAIVKEGDIQRLKEYGFDHVRIPIDEEQFWDVEGNKLPEAWTLLTTTLDYCVKYDMRAIVDLHIIRSHYFNAGHDGGKNTLFEDDAAQQKLIDMWYQLSDSLQRFPNKYVAYEFMNEPVADDHEQWNQLVAKVHKALREREPNRTLVIGSNMWQGYDTMKYLKVPENDKHILLSCHFYHPMALTHYKAGWTEFGEFSGTIHYPGVMISQEEFDQLDERRQEIFRQFTDEWNRERLEKMVGEAAKVAKDLGLPLYCGEWGVYESVKSEDKYDWYRDMISIFDEYDMSWATWCYYSGFGFWNLYRQEISDQKMLDILTSGKALGE